MLLEIKNIPKDAQTPDSIAFKDPTLKFMISLLFDKNYLNPENVFI